MQRLESIDSSGSEKAIQHTTAPATFQVN